METSDALATLDLPRHEGYYERPIPCAADSRIGRAVKAFTAAPPVWQASFREAIDLDRADLLCAWSERMAAMAVRLESPRPLVLGLVALSLADESGDGEAQLVARSASSMRRPASPTSRAPAGCATRATPTTRLRTPATSKTARATSSVTCGPPAPSAASASEHGLVGCTVR
jgi:hypothetical protein